MFHHHIHTALSCNLPYLGRDVLTIVIDGVVRPEGAGPGQLLFAAGRRDHAAMEHFGDLDGRRTHAAGGRQHQHVLARPQLRARDEHVPGREKDQRHGGGLFETQVVWNGDDAVLRSRQQFDVTAIHAVAEHLVAAAQIVVAGKARLALPAAQPRREQHAPASLDAFRKLAHLDDLARDIAAQHVRHVEFHSRDASPDKQVQVVERTGPHPHQHLVRGDPRFRGIFIDQRIGPAMPMNSSDLHAYTSRPGSL